MKERSSMWLNTVIAILALAMVFYHLLASQRLIVGVIQHSTIHLGFALVLVFLNTLKSVKTRVLWPVVMALAVAALVVATYIFFRVEYLQENTGFIRSPIDWVIGILLILLVLEGGRQAFGWVLWTVVVIGVAYFFLGQYLPGSFATRHFTPEYIVSSVGIGFQGMYDFVAISANYIFLFIVFGGLLGVVGGLSFFVEVGRLLGRVLAGGPAQTAVAASGLLGMVIGQGVTNVLLVGSFTIPLMKKVGYQPHEAGGIEAAASSGGQIMPPVMGEGVFLMATFIGMSYVSIMLRSFLAAFLYFGTVALAVQVLAYKIKVLPPKEAVNVRVVIMTGPLFIVPLGLLTGMLLARYTPSYSAFWAILVTALLPLARKATRIPWRTYQRGFVHGAVSGARLGACAAMIGILVQTINSTGFGVSVAYALGRLSSGNIPLALLCSMVVCLVLGMGMPTIAVYVIVAVVMAPVLVNLGVSMLSAHLFCFWYGAFSSLTPPVAMCSLAGAAIAGASYVKTCIAAVRVAAAAIVIPWFIVYCPLLTAQGQATAEEILVLIALPLSLFTMVVVIFFHLYVPTKIWEWPLWLLATALLMAFAITKVVILFPIALIVIAPAVARQWMARQAKIRRARVLA